MDGAGGAPLAGERRGLCVGGVENDSSGFTT